MKVLTTSAIALALALASLGAFAQEATIRKNLTERLPKLPPIDEISKTPMEGLYEVRVNQSEIFYTDAQGNFLIQGNLIDVRAQEDLTEKRQAKLTEIDFKDLPIKDAFTADGDVVVPLDVENIGFWLKGAFGQPTTAASLASPPAAVKTRRSTS